VLIGGSGPRSLQVAAEHGDGWIPIVEDISEFETQLPNDDGCAGRRDVHTSR
jgi:alkanesulfonate monooxygenase SsuD/methylene tetrahydromethanopterin reductase-like flavin-dependent oxidoreductase (luciferase family)